jgi:hypothetical protein
MAGIVLGANSVCLAWDAANCKASHPEKRRRGTNEAKLPF